MTLTPLARAIIHTRPSPDLTALGLKPLWRLLAPSELSSDVTRILCLESATQASISGRTICTTPQPILSQNERASSSITQSTKSQGNPFLPLSVTTEPFFNRLSPSWLATHS